MPCARSFSPKCYICIQRHISCKWYNFSFFSKQRNTHFFYMFIYKRSLFSLYIYIFIYIISYINQLIFSTLFQGRHRTHTGYRGMPHLHCFLHSTVGWLAGVMSSRQCCSWWVYEHTHTTPTFFPSLFCCFCFYPRQPHIILIPWHQPMRLVASHCLDDIRVGAGSNGWPNKLQME